MHLYGCLVAWKSRALRTHALSSTEAEYLALSEVCCEILFIKQLLEFFGRDVDYPIIIHCGNVGAIYLAHNAKNSRRTKHINLKAHFIREYVEDDTIKIIFSDRKKTTQTFGRKILLRSSILSIRENSWK